MDRPSPFTPGNCCTKAGVTAALMILVVLPATPRPVNTKSSTVTFEGILQAYPAGFPAPFSFATQKSAAWEEEENRRAKRQTKRSIFTKMLLVIGF
jgi:hypothetical protein